MTQTTNVTLAGDTKDHQSVVTEMETNVIQEENSPEVEPTSEEKEVSPEEQLKQLTDFRRNGSVTFEMTYDQFKKLRNTFKNDIPWKGPNQAYLLSILMLNLEQTLASLDSKDVAVQKIGIRNDSVEAMSVFLNSIEGKNSHSAQASLGMFLSIQQGIAQLQSVDAQIKQLEEQLSTKEEKIKK